MDNALTLIKRIALGWFCFCYSISLILLPVFPFITTGFNGYLAAAIIFLSPILFAVQGGVIGLIVWLGLWIYHNVIIKFMAKSLPKFVTK